MPIAPIIALGSTTSADTYFYDTNGSTPLQTVGGVIYNVYAPNNLKVVNGIATQDFANPAHWTAQISIPTNAPICNTGQFYTLQWVGNTATGKYVQTQQFVVQQTELPELTDAVVVAPQNTPFEIDLVLPYSSIQTLSLRIIDSAENVILQTISGALPLTASSQNGVQFIYRIPITDPTILSMLSVTNNTNPYDYTDQSDIFITPNVNSYTYGNSGFGVLPYMAYINYTDPYGGMQIELQPIYICSTLMLQLMKNMQNYIDILRNNDTIPQLRVSESKLVHFLIQGLLRFNSENPQYIQYNFCTLPPMFQFMVQKAACYEFLQALYMGEGMTSFNFSGMSVSLDSDRTQYIATLMGNLEQDLAGITIAKKNFAKSGAGTGLMGSIGTTVGPNFNFVFNIRPIFGGVGGSGLGYFGLPFLG